MQDQNKNPKYNNQLDLIQGENVNVENAHDGKDFFVLLGGLFAIVILFLSCYGLISDIVIDNLSNETQMKIETFFAKSEDNRIPEKYNKKIEYLTRQKDRIVELDKNLQNKSSFPISVSYNPSVNAMIYPNGQIYFTTGILDKNYTNRELTFVLAHELGHYAHRDHLKSVSKQLAVIFLCIITGQDTYVQRTLNSISEMHILHHSRRQEKAADLYASNMLIRLYGTNEDGKNFIKKISKKSHEVEFLQYFSTHPSWKKRLKTLEKQS